MVRRWPDPPPGVAYFLNPDYVRFTRLPWWVRMRLWWKLRRRRHEQVGTDRAGNRENRGQDRS